MEEINHRVFEQSGHSFYQNRQRSRVVAVKKCSKSLKKYVKEFCETSSIQGLSHMVKDITVLERCWWIMVFVLGLSGSCYMVYQIFDKWATTPVLVSLGTKEMSIHEIPFPAVTICPEAKISTKCLNYTNILNARKSGNILSTEFEENMYFDYMALLCKTENHKGTMELVNETLKQIYDDLEYMNDEASSSEEFDGGLEDYSQFLSECSATEIGNNMCFWMGKQIPCKDVMTPIITDEGLCYSFNMFDVRDIYSDLNTMKYYPEGNRRRDWVPDEEYKEQTDHLDNMYPRRAFLSGAKHSFVVVFLTNKKDINYACREFSIQGIRVSLHTPYRIPRLKQVFFSVGLDRLTTVAVNPIQTTTTNKIKAYDPEKRYCYFRHERNLKYFRFYSQANCNLECWTNYTISQCGCVNFWMPRDNKTRVCHLNKRFCLENARLSYNNNILKERLRSQSTRAEAEDDIEESTPCQCIPLCSDLTYNAEIASVDWDILNSEVLELSSVPINTMLQYHASALKVFFKNPFFLPTQRGELYGTTDMISNIGGALGLITGFSLVSLAEIIYFLSVRLIENYRKYGYWAGPST